MNSADSNANQLVIKLEVDEIPSELMMWEDLGENLQQPVKSEEDEILRPSDPPESAECFAIKTEEVHIYSVLPEEEIPEPSESPGLRRSNRKAAKSKYRAKPKQTGEFSCSTCGVKCPSEAKLKQHESKVHHVEIAHHPCSECEKVFFTEQELRTHKGRMHESNNRIDIQEETSEHPETESSTSNTDVSKCYICTTVKHFKDDSTLDDHLEKFHPRKNLYQCQECNISTHSITAFNRHLTKHDVKLKPYKCSLCPSRFSKGGYLRQHEADIHLINNGRTKRRRCTKCKITVYVTKWDEHVCSHPDIIHVCPICDLEFSTKNNLSRHVANAHETAPTPKDVEASQIFRCYLCEPATDMEDEKLLQEHLLAFHPQQDVYHCAECDKYFEKVTSHNQHLQRHDASIRPFKCGHCPLRFVRVTIMRQHEVEVHEINNGRRKRRFQKRRTCRICKKTIFCEKFEEHMQTKHPSNNHVCSTCGMEFLYENILRQHVASVHNSVMFKCYLCNSDSVFERKEHLQGHLDEAHSAQSEFQCEKCNYSTTIVSNFNYHLAEHDGSMGTAEQTDPKLKPDNAGTISQKSHYMNLLKCYLCYPHIMLETVQALKEHLKTGHVSRFQYECVQCSYSTKFKLNFNNHHAKHDATVKPFQCSICSQRFYTLRRKLFHEASEHGLDTGKKFYPCLECDNKYPHINRLKEHQFATGHHGTRKRVQKIDNNQKPKPDTTRKSKSNTLKSEKLSSQTAFVTQTSEPGDPHNSFKCYLCSPNTSIASLELLHQHLKVSHQACTTYQCGECRTFFREKRTFNQHLSRHDASIRPFKCIECPLRFYTIDSQKQHEADIHRVENGRSRRKKQPPRRQCIKCKKTIRLSRWDQHGCVVPSTTGNSMMKNVEDSLTSSSDSHKPSGTETSPLVKEVLCLQPVETTTCDEKTDPNKRSAKSRQMAQTKLRCYLCSTDLIGTSKTLKNHMEAYHFSRFATYHCRKCDYSTPQNSAFNNHCSRHDKSTRKFRCRSCSLRFLTAQCRQLHEVYMHGDKTDKRTHSCTVCDKKFYFKCSLKYHRKVASH